MASRRSVFVGLMAFVLLQSPLDATVLVPMELDALVDGSELIVSGTVVHSEVVVSGDESFPFTFVTFTVEDLLKGAVEGPHLTLRLPGGALKSGVVEVEGAPRFDLGESYLLFVDGNGTTRFPVVGWTQGQLRFARAPRSGAKILVDAAGVPVRGVRGGRWLKAPAGDEPAIVLSTEGVKISAVPPADGAFAADQPDAAVPADQVLAGLRELIRTRGGLRSFVPGRRVESARPVDVPWSFALRATPAEPSNR